MLLNLFVGRELLDAGEFAENYRRAIESSDEVADAIQEVTGCRCVIDSTKNPLRLIAYRQWSNHRIRCIYLKRDGRAVAQSHIRRGSGGWVSNILRWHAQQVKARFALSRTQIDVISVQYENLCRDPERELARIRSQLDLPKSTPRLAVSKQHLIPGNPMLFEGFPTVAEDLRWQAEMSLAKQVSFRIVERLLGPLMWKGKMR